MQRGQSGRRGKEAAKEVEREVEPERERPALRTRLSINSQNFVMCRVGSFDEHYVITGKIGEGSFGTVYRVKHKVLKLERALKTIKKRGEGHFSSFEEIQVLKRLDHSNILKIYEFYEAPESYFIITEIFQGKELFDLVLEQERITEQDAANILQEVLRAVNYTHSQGIAHRDIKPENILVRKSGQRYRVKIIDWGLGTLMGKAKANRVCGTPEYCAPQVLRGSYSLSCDMWSIGAIAYVMLTGEMPFSGKDTEQTITVVKKGVFNTQTQSFKDLSSEARKFVTSLMDRNPDRRMKASDALNHDWIKMNSSKDGEPVFLKETLERLKEIKLNSTLSTAVISYVNNHLSEDSQREKLQQIFKHLDTNSDGVLSLQELVEGYSNIYGKQVGKQIALDTFNKLDMNNNRSLQFSQFVTFGLRQQKQQEQGKLREAFNLFDRDKNGKICKEEIALVLKGKIDASIEAELSEIIRDIDQNGDQEIDVQEFIKSIQKIPNESKKEEKVELESKPQKSKGKKAVKAGDAMIPQSKTRATVKKESVIERKPSRLLRSNSKGLI